MLVVGPAQSGGQIAEALYPSGRKVYFFKTDLLKRIDDYIEKTGLDGDGFPIAYGDG